MECLGYFYYDVIFVLSLMLTIPHQSPLQSVGGVRLAFKPSASGFSLQFTPTAPKLTILLFLLDSFLQLCI